MLLTYRAHWIVLVVVRVIVSQELRARLLAVSEEELEQTYQLMLGVVPVVMVRLRVA